MKRPTILAFFLMLSTVACTARSAYVMPPQIRQRYLITAGNSPRPYQSLGYIQITQKGADLFGFVPIVDADLEKMFGDVLIREMTKRGADGVVNVHFHERQYTTAQRIWFAFPLFFFPLPTKVELTGELIRFVEPAPDAAEAPVAPAGAPVSATPAAPPASL